MNCHRFRLGALGFSGRGSTFGFRNNPGKLFLALLCLNPGNALLFQRSSGVAQRRELIHQNGPLRLALFDKAGCRVGSSLIVFPRLLGSLGSICRRLPCGGGIDAERFPRLGRGLGVGEGGGAVG